MRSSAVDAPAVEMGRRLWWWLRGMGMDEVSAQVEEEGGPEELAR